MRSRNDATPGREIVQELTGLDIADCLNEKVYSRQQKSIAKGDWRTGEITRKGKS